MIAGDYLSVGWCSKAKFTDGPRVDCGLFVASFFGIFLSIYTTYWRLSGITSHKTLTVSSVHCVLVQSASGFPVWERHGICLITRVSSMAFFSFVFTFLFLFFVILFSLGLPFRQLAVWLVCWLTGCLDGSWADWMAGWLAVWLTG